MTVLNGFFNTRRQALALALLCGGALLGSLPAAAQQPVPERLRGTIESVDGKLLVIKSRGGESVKVRLAEKARIGALVHASLADVKAGTFVGITSMPDGEGRQKALEVHIFPEALRGTGEGQRPWDLGEKSKMTNGNVDLRVDAVAGQELTMSFKGGSSKIAVTPDTTIVAFAPAEPGDFKPGNKVIVFGLKKGEDGTLEAGAISIGRDGLTPPM
jgi:hypothetical protein